MGATIKDIAKKLNISVSTVSYALNGGPRNVPEDVKRRVFEIAKELDYHPNRLARSLATRRCETVGIAFDRTTPDLLLSPFRLTVLNSIVNSLKDRGYDTLLMTGVTGDLGQPILPRLLDGRVDGIVILSPLMSEEVLKALDQREFPYVTIAAGADRSAADFSIDNQRGIEIGLEYLASLGHRSIGHISGLWELRDGVERETAFRESVQKMGLITDDRWIRPGDFTDGGGERAAVEILLNPSHPTAIMCANDESARGAMRSIRRLGIEVPKSLSVLGFDDLPLAAILDPPLSTIRQPLVQIGDAAVEQLISLIDGGPSVSKRFEPALIVRGSTSRPPEDIPK